MFPGDDIPQGDLWDTLIANELAAWCPWSEFTEGFGHSVELHLQAGIGAPSAAQIDAAGGERITIPGADAAYRFSHGEAISEEILAVAGPNRLLVRAPAAQAVTAAVFPLLQP